MNIRKINKGDLYIANLNPIIGSEQGGVRPVVVLQNNKGNYFSPTIVIALLTKLENNKTEIPTHVILKKDKSIKEDSLILIEQIRSIDKSRLNMNIGKINKKKIEEVNNAIRKELDI